MKPVGGISEKELDREQLETILRETVAGIAVVSPRSDGISLDYTNDAFFGIFGYTRSEYESLGNNVWLNLFNPVDFMNLISKINTVTEPGKVQNFECRINKKGGEKGWVIISTRKPANASAEDLTFIINIVDITALKNLQKQIEEEKEKYEIVEEISDNVLFTYDVITDVLDCSPKVLRGLRRKNRLENAIEALTYGDVFDLRDIPTVIEAFSNGLSGKRLNVFDARIINNRDDSVWYRIRFATIFNADGNPVRFVGTMIDIDQDKKEKSRLISQAETDQLTGFLNKISTSLKISESINENPNDESVLFLLDIDNFKALNDTYGHSEGDNFLRDFTANIARSFRPDDVLGRVGGEEFVVFLKSIGDNPEMIREKAMAIQAACHTVRLASVPDKEFSCSIGVAVYPDNGLNYAQLYSRADKALYYVKKHGKNNFANYDKETMG